jgi:hypothetical protein
MGSDEWPQGGPSTADAGRISYVAVNLEYLIAPAFQVKRHQSDARGELISVWQAHPGREPWQQQTAKDSNRGIERLPDLQVPLRSAY